MSNELRFLIVILSFLFEKQRDSSCEKAIEEFMRSPRASQNNPKLSIKKSPTVMTSGNTKNGLAK